MDYLFLATDYPPQVGGIQTYHSHLAAALQWLGRQVHVIATEHPGWQDYDAASPVPVTRVPTKGGKPAIYRRLRDEAIRIGSDGPLRGLISTKWSPEAPGSRQAADALDVPWGLFGHDREFILHGANVLKWLLQQYLFDKTNFCFAISNYAADNFRRAGVPDARLRMVGCGIDSDRFRPDAARAAALRAHHNLGDSLVLLTVARVVPRKGHLTVIQALPQIISALGPARPVKYLIVGDGEHLPALQAAVAARNLQDSVIFAGRAPDADLCGYYTLADLMVMPSYDIPGKPSEGFGLTFLEANCCETAVIGSRTGGIPDAVDHGLTGLLVPPRSPQSLARAAIQLLRDPDALKAMGLHARRRAEQQFTWNLVARRVDAAFGELWQSNTQ
ncbi:MAG: glycosyltransferase family 4 protein [Armatimonadia bacterium]